MCAWPNGVKVESSDTSDGWLVVWPDPGVRDGIGRRWFRREPSARRYLIHHDGPKASLVRCPAGQETTIVAAIRRYYLSVMPL
jgi:hypothetical protein